MGLPPSLSTKPKYKGVQCTHAKHEVLDQPPPKEPSQRNVTSTTLTPCISPPPNKNKPYNDKAKLTTTCESQDLQLMSRQVHITSAWEDSVFRTEGQATTVLRCWSACALEGKSLLKCLWQHFAACRKDEASSTHTELVERASCSRKW